MTVVSIKKWSEIGTRYFLELGVFKLMAIDLVRLLDEQVFDLECRP